MTNVIYLKKYTQITFGETYSSFGDITDLTLLIYLRSLHYKKT